MPQVRPGAAAARDWLAIAWWGRDDNLLFQRSSPETGRIEGSERTLTTLAAPSASLPDVAVAGERVAVAFVDAREGQQDVFLSVLDEEGEPTSPNGRKMHATSADGADPQVVWTGERFVVAWNEDRRVFVAEADADGVPIEDSARLVAPWEGEPGGPDPSESFWGVNEMLWESGNLLLIATRAAAGRTTETVVLRVGADGSQAPRDLVVLGSADTDSDWSSEPPLAVGAGGSEVLVVWGQINHAGAGATRIRMARMRPLWQ